MSYSSGDDLRDARSQGITNVLEYFFGASAVEGEWGDESIRCRFDAQAPDGSKEVRWVTIRKSNTPEQNMDILRDARRRQAWYEERRHEMPGIDVPLPEAEEKLAAAPPAHVN